MTADLKLFDHYSFRARLQPALLTLLPAALAVFAWTGPGARWVSALWTLFGTAGGTFFLANVVRNRGRELEPALWSSWGGPPTTQLLRHTGPANPLLRERWHKQLSQVLGKRFPTQQQEAVDSAGADDLYGAATRLLIDRTRDTKVYPLVYKENILYGFCRNLYGMKPTGVAVSLLGIVGSCGAWVWFWKFGTSQTAPFACAAGSAVLLIWWLTIVKSSWVKQPALAYAERLLESTEKLSRTKERATAVSS